MQLGRERQKAATPDGRKLFLQTLFCPFLGGSVQLMGGRHRDAGHFGAWRATDDARGATENVYDQSSRICRATAWALPDIDEVFAQTGEVSVNH